MRKITKKLLKTHTGELKLSKCGDWLTNGAWAVKRSTIDGAEAWSDQERLRLVFGGLAGDPDKDGPDLERMVPDLRDQSERFERTHWQVAAETTYEDCRTLTLYLGDKGNVAFVTTNNSDFLERPVLYGSVGRWVTAPERGYYCCMLVDATESDNVDTLCMPHGVSAKAVDQAKRLTTERD